MPKTRLKDTSLFNLEHVSDPLRQPGQVEQALPGAWLESRSLAEGAECRESPGSHFGAWSPCRRRPGIRRKQPHHGGAQDTDFVAGCGWL